MMRDFSRKRLFWSIFSNRKVAKEALEQNEILISSTDTIYGFLGNVTIESFERIAALKQVSQFRPFLILISSADKLSHFVDPATLSNDILRFLDRCWPGPVTVVCKAKPGLPRFLLSDEGTVALRCPDHAGLQAILPEFDGLFSTSANVSDQQPPQQFFDIDPHLVDQVSYVVVDEESFDESRSKPSSIIDISSLDYSAKTQSDGLPFVVVREGVYSKQELKELYEKSKSTE